ncbi:MAG: hypothetical protein PF904_06625 [Kiritimatiellae bacterium]|jgi:hypothetical protein|nr:hypothetical protein [Kiritimatiellia bacterium]
MFAKKAPKICFFSAVIFSLASALLLYSFSCLFGNLNQDEGWYLYAAKSVSVGLHPYKDFFYTQAPVMPWFYSAFEGIWGRFGVLGGRVFTAVLGLLSSLCVAFMASRAVSTERSRSAGVIAFALVSCNLYHVYFTTIPKTYALTSLFLYSGCLLLTLCFFRERKSHSRMSRMWALPAGILIALAAGVRLSIGALLPVITLVLLLNFRKSGSAFFWFALGSLIGLLTVFAPVYLHAKDEFIFSQSFHVSRAGNDIFLIAGSLSRLIRAYLTQFVLFGALCLAYLFLDIKGGTVCDDEHDGYQYHGKIWPLIWFLSFLAVFAVQIISPHPYDDYQVPVMGLFSAALAAWVVNIFKNKTHHSIIAFGLVCTVNVCSFSSPLIQEWVTDGQDRFWVQKKESSDIMELQAAARDISALLDGHKELLTQDLYLAVEADLRVPRGLEMGPFGYFPDLSDKDALKYHVFNKEGLHKLIFGAPCEVAAFSGYGLAIQAPVMDPVPHKEYQRFMKELSMNYDFVQEIPHFGQHNTLLQILKRRKSIAE